MALTARRRRLSSLLIAALIGLAPITRGHAQQTKKIDMNQVDQSEVIDAGGNPSWSGGTQQQQKMDSLRPTLPHLVHLAPHVLYFDSRTKSATVTFSNPTNRRADADVQVLFTYPVWPHGRLLDTTVITPSWERLIGHDTIVLDPVPTAPFVGYWLTGVPSHVTLAPHQSQRITVQLAPPATLPAGEYWARIVAIARPPQPPRGKDKDTRRHYAMPLRVNLPDTLRDSTQLFYWSGPQRQARLAFGPGGTARLDTLNAAGGPHGGGCQDRIWIRLPAHLVGTTHVDGRLLVMIRNQQSWRVVLRNIYAFSMYHPDSIAVTHWWGHLCCFLEPGPYKVVVQFIGNTFPDSPDAKRMRVDTVTYTIPTLLAISHSD